MTPRRPKIDRESPNTIRELFLVTTGRCNLSCRYCSAEAGMDAPSLELSTAEETVKNWIGAAEAKKLSLVFTGGEPLLWGVGNLAQVCAAAATAAREKGIALHIGLQTNGTLLDDDFIELCRAYNLEPSISLDGPPELSDPHRGMAGRVVENLKRLQAGGIGFAVIACLTRQLACNMDSALDWFKREGFLKLRINVLGPVPPPRLVEALTAAELLAAKVRIVEHILFNGPGGVAEYNVSRQIFAVKQALGGLPVNKNYCDRLDCGAGVYIAALLPGGKLALCVERSLAGALPQASGFSALSKASLDFFGGISGWEDCGSCPAGAICDYGCPAYHRFDRALYAENCKANKEFFKYLLGRLALAA